MKSFSSMCLNIVHGPKEHSNDCHKVADETTIPMSFFETDVATILEDTNDLMFSVSHLHFVAIK